MGQGVLSRYGEYLPLTRSTPMITIGEGSTPLVRSRTIEKELGVGRLYFKLEGCNPTGSFKDRGMVVAVAKALEANAEAIMCASTGNTSASASAFGARFGLATYVLAPKGRIAKGKLSQALVHGAKLVSVDGSFDEILRIAQTLTETYEVAFVNSLKPQQNRRAEDGSLRDSGRSGRCPELPVRARGQRREYHGVLEGFQRIRRFGKGGEQAADDGFSGCGGCSNCRREANREPSNISFRDQNREPGELEWSAGGGEGVGAG